MSSIVFYLKNYNVLKRMMVWVCLSFSHNTTEANGYFSLKNVAYFEIKEITETTKYILG